MKKNTSTSELRLKERTAIEWYSPVKKRRGEELVKNMGVAAALVLCAVTLRAGAVPPLKGTTDVVLASVSGDTLLDDQLGKLSFVSKLFPEATLVFGESHAGDLSVPVSGGVVVHAWSEAEPYLAWRTSGSKVTAVCSGTVMGVYHGEDEERLVQIMGDQGISCVYGNLRGVEVQAGDYVQAGDVLGDLLDNCDCVFEVRVDGISVDPMDFLASIS